MFFLVTFLTHGLNFLMDSSCWFGTHDHSVSFFVSWRLSTLSPVEKDFSIAFDLHFCFISWLLLAVTGLFFEEKKQIIKGISVHFVLAFKVFLHTNQKSHICFSLS